MKYTTLGNTGLVVSRLAFGAMTFTAGKRDLATIAKVGGKLADERLRSPSSMQPPRCPWSIPTGSTTTCRISRSRRL
jgi:hypothetical protein